MRSDISLMGLAAMAASVSAQAATEGFNSIVTPCSPEKCVAGTTTVPITWSLGSQGRGDENVCIQLICGDSQSTLVPEPNFGQIACGVRNSALKFDWPIPANLPQYGMCGIKMYLQNEPNTMQYSGPFQVETQAGRPTQTESSQPQLTVTQMPSSPVTSSLPAATSAAMVNSTLSISTIARNCAGCGSGGDSDDGVPATASRSGVLATQTRVAGVANPSGGLSGSGATARPATPVTAGASAVGAGILSVVGGLAVAVLAL